MSNVKHTDGPLFRPPIVAVLGHVDHGKTTLLDYIRKTQVAAKEHGGITQHIGAYQIKMKDSKIKNNEDVVITFIDTPGHEAFMNMRSRGANVADLALLVVAADDSVMPQTKESLRLITEAQIPFFVVVTKIDLPSANVEKVKQDLARNSIQVEGFGGEIPIFQVSAKAGTGIDELLHAIAAFGIKQAFPFDAKSPFEGVVIETHVDKGKGMVASLVVKKGVLEYGASLFDGTKDVGKVRALFDEKGVVVRQAFPGKPVEVLGFSTLPEIGSTLTSVPRQKEIPTVVSQKEQKEQSIPDFLSMEAEKKTLKIIIKADTAGSLEAVIASLGDGATIVSSGVGEITEADVLLAKSTGAFVIGFNTKWKQDVERLATLEGVVIRGYTIIYELLDELREVLAGMQEVLTKERELGKGEIIAEFPFDKQKIAGTKVTSGRIAKGDQVKIFRGETEIAKLKIKSLRVGKEDTTKVESGKECGILFDKNVDFEPGDAIIAFIRN